MKTLILISLFSFSAWCEIVPGIAIKTCLKSLENHPFFKAARDSGNQITACQVTGSGEDQSVRIEFEGPSKKKISLTQTRQSPEVTKTELSGIEMDLPRAIELLKAAEAKGFSSKGCQINWSKPEIEKNQKIYWGETCNCQGRVTGESKIVAVLFGTAC